MIRREIHFPGKKPHWLLISQKEHARVSAMMADRCLSEFGQSVARDDLVALRAELLAAIVHHDDGWVPWDAAPHLDTKHHRPPSFREMRLEDVLPIWTSSIKTAAAEGPLAGLTVAGHFIALLEASEKEFKSALARDWQQDMAALRDKWFADWQGVHPTLPTLQLAAEALLWLQLFDVASLWLCSACPGQDEQFHQPLENYHFAPDSLLQTRFRTLDQPGHVTFIPWRLDVPELLLEADGQIIPIREYHNMSELNEARQPHTVRWVLSNKRQLRAKK
ncbi:MAG TPA: hypothetical protein DHW22_12310 [Planctomycetaceae bacterium]|nr:hypothetical protein [Planctomycetaceae bacterium]